MSWSAKVAMCRVTSRRGGDRGWVRRASHRCESTGRETHPQLPCPFRLQLPPHACMAAEPPRTTAYIYTRRLLRRADERQRPSPKTEFCHSSVWPKSFCRARLLAFWGSGLRPAASPVGERARVPNVRSSGVRARARSPPFRQCNSSPSAV